MNLRKSVGLLFGLFVLCGLQAQAQFGIYGTYTANRLSGLTCFDPQGQCSSPNGVVNLTGGWGGAYYDWKTYGPARFGLDLRAGEGHSNKSASSSAGSANATSSQNVLAGVRASFHTPIHVLKPYAEVAAGWGRSNVTEPFGAATAVAGSPVPPRVYDQFVEYEGFAGLDIKLFPVLDLRLVELGLGNMNRLGSGQGPGSVAIKSIGLGVVFHLPGS